MSRQIDQRYWYYKLVVHNDKEKGGYFELITDSGVVLMRSEREKDPAKFGRAINSFRNYKYKVSWQH